VGAGESALARLKANWRSVVESTSGTLFGQKNNGRWRGERGTSDVLVKAI
jgi:hypothetical protein